MSLSRVATMAEPQARHRDRSLGFDHAPGTVAPVRRELPGAALLRQLGNQRVCDLVGGLTVGAARDRAEQAADRAADAALRQLGLPGGEVPAVPAPAKGADVCRDTDPAGDGAVGPEGGEAGYEVSRALRARRGAGVPLDPPVRQRFERAFGADLGAVRVHTGPEPDALSSRLSARAFTYGTDIYFARDQYRPYSPAGQRVLAHELAHVRQGEPEIHRLLWDVKTFRKETDLGFGSGSKTMDEIARLLGVYEERTRAGDPPFGPEMDAVLILLDHIIEDIDLWLSTHEGSKAHQRREVALKKLRADADAERTKLERVRAEAVRQGALGERGKAENHFKFTMETDASSALMKLAPLVSAAVPTPGDTAEISVELTVPVAGTPAKFGVRLSLSVARVIARKAGDWADPADQGTIIQGVRTPYEAVDTTAVTFESALVGGVGLLGAAELSMGLGCYLEAQGRSPKHTMQLIAWGWYRTLYEAGVPAEIIGLLFGGSMSKPGWRKAKRWAANVQADVFKDTGMPIAQNAAVGSQATGDTYLRLGVFGEVGAEAKFATPGGLGFSTEFSVRLSGGTHFSRATIESRESETRTKGTRQGLGRDFMHLSASAGVTVGPFGGELEFWVEFMGDNKEIDYALRPTYVSGWVHATGTLPATTSFAESLGTAAKDVVPKIVAAIRKVALWRDDKRARLGRTEWLGELVAIGEDLNVAVDNLKPDAKVIDPLAKQVVFGEGEKAFVPAMGRGQTMDFGEEAGGLAPETEAALKFSFGFGIQLDWTTGRPKLSGLNIDLILAHEKGLEFDLGGFPKVAASRSRRILRAQYEKERAERTGVWWWD